MGTQFKKYDEDFKRKAVARLQAGEAGQKIAKELGVSDVSIYYWRKKMFPESSGMTSRGVTKKTASSKKTLPKKPYDAEFKKGIVARVSAGERVSLLAKEIKVAPGLIYGWTKKFRYDLQSSADDDSPKGDVNFRGIIQEAIIYLREVKKVVTGDLRQGKRAELDRGHLHALLALSELEKAIGK